MTKLSLLAGLLAVTATLGAPASANAPMDAAEIDRAVMHFTGAGIGQPGGARLPVDRRMRLNPCGAPLQLEWYGSSRESVQVQCPDAGWRIYVAVAQAQPQPGQAETYEIVVSRGETVSIVVEGGGFSLSRQAVAMEEGAVGSWIQVRPAQDRKADPVRAQVVRPGQVAVRVR
ncbi:flagella basal body P-ring formation protein FlgA [Alteriqipengyuania lutimaris]|uniref:Flagellar protein n=1 Tax=Alteriqipengyuania lutimaris TaxID=1538146 RepID=A0A395LNI6_9SPHN|nr:flagella basal body P-ring formation protein FlgA [Alteriqipengyuania lutimaris]MBB3033973.1 flagella basal body P-ring formation protein FlgA [Alteriqipengyuania lutimaris]RDS77074.1 flagellar protein [Alteriqipengyuania lutimaris]